jgi:hypothetical protein
MSSSARPAEIVEDFLTVDSSVPGQNYVCLSFLSPDKVIKKKEDFFYTKFIQHVVNNRERMLNKDTFTVEEVTEMIEDYRFVHSDEVDREFDEKNNFQTSVRGVKVRGVYDTLREAQVRSEQIRKRDPNHNVFVGQVGYWLPWDPDFHKIKDVNYQENQLNDLMRKYNENIQSRDDVYNEDTKRRIQMAKEEGRRREQQAAEAAAAAEAATTVTAASSNSGDNAEIPASAQASPSTPQVSEEEAKQKIAEMRELVDEKDRMFSSVDPWSARKNI